MKKLAILSLMALMVVPFGVSAAPQYLEKESNTICDNLTDNAWSKTRTNCRNAVAAYNEKVEEYNTCLIDNETISIKRKNLEAEISTLVTKRDDFQKELDTAVVTTNTPLDIPALFTRIVKVQIGLTDGTLSKEDARLELSAIIKELQRPTTVTVEKVDKDKQARLKGLISRLNADIYTLQSKLDNASEYQLKDCIVPTKPDLSGSGKS